MSSDITERVCVYGGGVQGRRFDLLLRNAQKELFYVMEPSENLCLMQVKLLPLVFFLIYIYIILYAVRDARVEARRLLKITADGAPDG